MDQEEVWTFTVGMYGRSGVAKLCLELQDRCGLDVNMLLFMFFLGQKGLAPHSISSLEDAVCDWRDNAIIPLRRRSEEHTSELQSHHDIVCRLLLAKKKKTTI